MVSQILSCTHRPSGTGHRWSPLSRRVCSLLRLRQHRIKRRPERPRQPLGLDYGGRPLCPLYRADVVAVQAAYLAEPSKTNSLLADDLVLPAKEGVTDRALLMSLSV